MPLITAEDNVLVVDASTSVRNAIKQALKSNGFNYVTTLPSLKDAIESLESVVADWLIAPLEDSDGLNLFQFLSLRNTQTEISNIKVSAVFNSENFDDLLMAYDMGVLSHFKAFENAKAFEEELKAHLDAAKSDSLEYWQLAARHLRSALLAEKKWDDLTDLEKQLCQNNPGEPEQLLNLAKAHLYAGESELAESYLAQIQLVDPSYEKEIMAIADRYLGGKRNLSMNADDSPNLLGLEHVVVIDGEESVANSIKEVLGDLGVPKVDSFETGNAAIEALSNLKDTLSLVIQEWRVKGIPGYLLIQKIRNSGFTGIPIVVLSSLVSKEDAPLVHEFGASCVIEKPFSKELFLQNLMSVLQNELSPTQPDDIERKIRKLANSNQIAQAKSILKLATEKGQFTKGYREICMAHIATAEENWKLAAEQSARALPVKTLALLAQNVLGKALMKLGEYQAAVSCFEKAKQLSPKNVERLCMLAEAQQLNGDEETALSTLKDATSIDSNSAVVQKATLNTAMTSDNPDTVVELARKLDAEDDVVALTNNRAVAFVKSGRIDEGVAMYESIINMLPKPSQVKLTPVHYNIGLALAKKDDFDDAIRYLNTAVTGASPEQDEIMKKARSLKIRIEEAIANGSALTLFMESKNGTGGELADEKPISFDNEAPNTEETASAFNADEILAAIQIIPQEACLHQIYTFERWSEERKKQAADRPRFKVRESVKREESFGLEKSGS